MGQYDNYSNEKNIAKAQKRLDKLTAKRDPDPYEVELARRELETAKLFERCQIFGTEGWKKSPVPSCRRYRTASICKSF